MCGEGISLYWGEKNQVWIVSLNLVNVHAVLEVFCSIHFKSVMA